MQFRGEIYFCVVFTYNSCLVCIAPPPPEIWLDLGSQDKKFPKQALTYRSGPLETTQNCQDNYIILAIGMKFLI